MENSARQGRMCCAEENDDEQSGLFMTLLTRLRVLRVRVAASMNWLSNGCNPLDEL